jgi:hypothetical protein
MYNGWRKEKASDTVVHVFNSLSIMPRGTGDIRTAMVSNACRMYSSHQNLDIPRLYCLMVHGENDV